MTTLKDWVFLFNPQALLLAFPALLSGLVLTWLSRNSTNDAALPLAMILIPALFYVVSWLSGAGLDGARDAGWVGGTRSRNAHALTSLAEVVIYSSFLSLDSPDVSPPVPVADLFRLVDFSLVRWDLIGLIVPTWLGMVLVVAFASSLDVAAISMDMGEALDTNNELKTVGIGNLFSGLTCGFTGSYIFSQTIFTYRTGSHSRWIGLFIMIVFAYVVVSPVNILQVAPLFFLGSTLIFIGYDLLYEWLFEIREKVITNPMQKEATPYPHIVFCLLISGFSHRVHDSMVHFHRHSDCWYGRWDCHRSFGSNRRPCHTQFKNYRCFQGEQKKQSCVVA